MEKLITKVLNETITGYVWYEYRGSHWIINPITKTWVITVSYSGYTFYNYFFFHNLFSYMSLVVPGNDGYICNWLRNGLGFTVGEHCYPDYLPTVYDWTKDFNVDEVIERGVIVASRPNSLRSRESQPFFENV